MSSEKLRKGELEVYDTGFLTSSPEVAARISELQPSRDPTRDAPEQGQVWTSGLVGAILDGIEFTVPKSFMHEFDQLVESSDETRDAMVTLLECLASESGEPAGCEQVTINADVPAPVAQAVKRAHIDLGHARPEEVLRIFRQAGASWYSLAAIRSMECSRCTETQKPQAARPSKVPNCPPPLTRIRLDLKEVRDGKSRKKRKFLGVIDEGTLYHQLMTIPSADAAGYRNSYRTGWSKPLGPPDEMRVDAEKALITGAMQKGAEREGTVVEHAAGEAHHLIGLIDRHNGAAAEIFHGILDDTQPSSEEEYEEAIHQLCCMKNQYLHKAGAIPEMGETW